MRLPLLVEDDVIVGCSCLLVSRKSEQQRVCVLEREREREMVPDPPLQRTHQFSDPSATRGGYLPVLQPATRGRGFRVQMFLSSLDPRPQQAWGTMSDERELYPAIATAGYELRHIPAKLKRSPLGIPCKLSTSLMEQ